MSIREVLEGQQVQGVNEIYPYDITVTNWGSDPTSPVAELYDTTVDPWVDKTATKLIGSCEIVGNVITTPAVTSLEVGHEYRMRVTFLIGANTMSCYVSLLGEW